MCVCVLVLLSIFQREKGTNNTKICKVKRAKSSRKNTRTRFSEGCLHIFPPFFIPRLCCCHPPTACPRPRPRPRPLPTPHSLLILPALPSLLSLSLLWRIKLGRVATMGINLKKKKQQKWKKNEKKYIYIKPRFFRQKRGEKNFCNENGSGN